MGFIRRFGVALALAGMMAGATVGLEAKKTTSTTSADSLAAICSYLWSVMTYEYVTPTVYLYAASLYNYYGCATSTTP